MEHTMEVSTVHTNLVNPKNLLFFTEKNLPAIRYPNGKVEEIPNAPFGPWYLRIHFQHLEATEEAANWIKKNDPTKYTQIPLLLNAPRLYQILALTRLQMSNAALWLDMGLGKTFITLAYAMQLYQQKHFLFLIVCPPSVFVTWEDEIRKHITSEAKAQIIVAHGDKRKQRLSALRTSQPTTPTFVLTSYETLESIRESIQLMPFSLIVFDEAAKIKNLQTKRTKTAHTLIGNFRPRNPRIILLSGTPSTTSPTGYYSLYELLWPGASGCPDFTTFKNKYTIQKTFLIAEIPQINSAGNISKTTRHIYAENSEKWLKSNYPPNSLKTYWDLGYSFSKQPHNVQQLKILRYYNKEDGAKNIAQLNAVTRCCAYVLKKEEVLQDLPEKILMKRHVDLNDEQRKIYLDVAQTHAAEIGNTRFSFKAQQSPFVKLHQIANGFLRPASGPVQVFKTQPKVEILLDLLEENEGEKIVVWSPLRAQLDIVQKQLKHEEISHVVMHGGIPPGEARTRIVHEFQQNPNCRVFLANPAVAGLGLNLTCSSIEVFLTNWYVADVRAQAEDRCHRDGQKNAVRIIDIIARNTIEEKILRDMKKRINLEDQILTMQDVCGEQA